MSTKLNSDRALIFRITHGSNVPWMLDNGLHCRNSDISDPKFVSIGNPELIDKRQHRVIDIGPGGTLSDYIPFYFTPFSPMMYNIKTGWGGIAKRRNEEIVILVSSLHELAEKGIAFVFSDRHAYLQTARFYSDHADLGAIDWTILQGRDFKRDPDDIGKLERYQAEALVHRHLPINELKGIVCYNDAVEAELRKSVEERGVEVKVISKPSWYF